MSPPRDFSVLVWVRDEGETPVYRVVKEKIKAGAPEARGAAGGRMRAAEGAVISIAAGERVALVPILGEGA